jgi:hypothetical protein
MSNIGLLLVNVHWEGDHVTHAKLNFGLVLNKDIDIVADVKQTCRCCVCEHLDKLSQLWMQALCLAVLRVDFGDFKAVNFGILDFSIASWLLNSHQILLLLKVDSLFAAEALDDPSELELVGLNWLGTSAVVHRNGDLDAFTHLEVSLLNVYLRFGLGGTNASNSANLHGDVLLDVFRLDGHLGSRSERLLFCLLFKERLVQVEGTIGSQSRGSIFVTGYLVLLYRVELGAQVVRQRDVVILELTHETGLEPLWNLEQEGELKLTLLFLSITKLLNQKFLINDGLGFSDLVGSLLEFVRGHAWLVGGTLIPPQTECQTLGIERVLNACLDFA